MNANVETILESSVDIHLAEQALELAKLRQRWSACKDLFAPVIAGFQRTGVEPYIASDYVVVKLTGDKGKLEQAFRILRSAGLTFSADRPKKGDSEWCAFFHHPETDTKVFFQFASSVCKRVKVGTKMVQQDVYETQCGDISADEPTPPLLSIVPATPALGSDEIPF